MDDLSILDDAQCGAWHSKIIELTAYVAVDRSNSVLACGGVASAFLCASVVGMAARPKISAVMIRRVLGILRFIVVLAGRSLATTRTCVGRDAVN